MLTTAHKTAVLLLAYGGPESLDDIPAYLLNIRGGRETPQHLIDEITDRYAQIGGSSPLLAITNSAANKLSAALGLPVYVGMRHWQPFIKDVVAQIAADGVEQLIAICMAPHYSDMSIGVYKKQMDEALAILAPRGTSLAAVVDTRDRTLGIVTLEDLVEPLVGDILDEHDAAAV
jgi:ferrochelatase